MKTSISKMLSRMIALALVFCLSAQMMPLQIMANDYNNQQLDEQIADKQSEIEKLETEVENMLGHEIGVNAVAEAQSAPVMMAADADDIVTVDHVVDGATVGTFTFDKSTGTITRYQTTGNTAHTVTIPDKIDGVSVTAIGDNAFQNSTMTAVVVPDSVTSIGSYAFANCSYVESVTLSEKITDIPDYAFTYCSVLKSINIPAGVTTIGSHAFDYCTAITTVDLPATVTEVESYAFYSCSKLANIDISNVKKIGSNAFRGCNALTSVTLNSALESLGAYAFYRSGLTSVDIPDTIRSIGEWTFAECKSLVSVTANNLTSIDEYAFSGCASLTGLPAMDNVSYIGMAAFAECTSLNQVDLYATEENLSVGNQAFSGCNALEKIVLHSSEKYYAYTTGNTEFAYSSPFRDVPEDVEFVFDVTKGSPVKIGEGLFCGASFITGTEDFSFIPASVVEYGDYAFTRCNFTEITVPEHIEKIGVACFKDCASLEKATILNAMSAWNITYWDFSDGEYVAENGFFLNTALYDQNDSDSKVDVTFPENWTEIPFGFFAGSKIRDTEFLTKMPNLKKIGAYAFQSCSYLENPVIPDGVETLGHGVFMDSLKKVKVITIPASVKSLGKHEDGYTGHFWITYGSYGLTDVYINNPELDLYHNDEDANPIFNNDKFAVDSPLKIHGVSGSTAQAFCEASDGRFVFVPVGQVGQFSLIVTKDGVTPITEGFTVEWKNSEGLTQSTNTTFRPHKAGLDFTYKISFTDDDLLLNYYIPEVGTVKSAETDTTITETLEAIPAATFTIKANRGAYVNIAQNINGVVTGMTEPLEVGEDGVVTYSGKKAYTEITVSLDGYYSEYKVISQPEATNTVTITMKKLPATSIIINATSTLDGVESPVTDLTDFTFTVKNSADETVPVRAEGGMLYLDEAAAASDENTAEIPAVTDELTLYVEVSSVSDLIAPQPITFKFNDSVVNVPFTSQGHISMNVATESLKDTEGFYLWIFDEEGKLADAYDMYYGICETDSLPEGAYNIVAIDMSVGIKSVPNIMALANFGLKPNSHYWREAASVVNGQTTNFDNVSVPNLLALDLYVNMFEQAQFDSSVAEPSIGQSFYLWFDYKLDDTYATTGEKEIIIQLPQGTSLDQCYTPEGTGSYVYDDKGIDGAPPTYTLTVTTTVNEGQVYLALTGTDADRYASVTASAKVNIDGATYAAKPVSHDLPIYGIRIESQDVMNGEIFEHTVTVYTQPHKVVNLYVNGEPYRASYNGTSYIDKTTPYEATPVGGYVVSNGDGKAVFRHVRLPGPASPSKTWAITASVKDMDMGDAGQMTVYSEDKKVITYNPDPFNVVVQIPLWPKNGKIYYNDYESTEYDSQKGGVNGFVDFWYWTAQVEQGMGKYIDRFWLKFRGGKGVSYMELNRVGADMFGAMDKADRNLWMSWLDYTYTLKDSYYTEYLNQPVAVYDYTEIAAEKQAVQDDLNDYENQKVNIDGNEVKLSDIDFEYLETLTENDYDRAAVLEFKALMAQASFEASGIVGVDDVRELSDEQLIEKMGITKVEITSDDLQDYANNPDFTKIEKDGSITHYVYADAENVISVDVNELTMTTHDYTALSSDNTQTFNVRKSSRSGSQQSTADMESGLKMVEEKVKEAQNTLTSVQFAIENMTEAADKYAKDSKLSDTLRAALSSKAKTVAQLGSKVLNHALTAYSFWEWGNITAEMSEIKNTTNSLLNEYARIKLSGKDEDFADKEACLKAIDSLIEANKELFDALMNKMLSLSAQLLAAFVSILVAIPSFGISLLVNLLAMLIGFELDSTFDENIEIARQLLKRSQRDKARDCRPDRDEDEDDADCNPIYDPSGYVYEGVFSNRVEGATVTTYKYGQTGKWNAEDFSQENPLITNSDGYYRWDVPVGYYKVVAEKNGYKTADTTEIYSKDKLGKDRNDISDGTHVDFDGKTVPAGWHKVLPIQTEVHIPLESTQAPEVESATAYSDSIIVQFSQYMKEETVEGNISVTMGGVEYKGKDLKIEWSDSEESNHYYNRTFASQLKISRADGETWTGEVTVSIAGGENAGGENYAGTKMESPYSVNLDVIPVIDEIENDGTVYVEYGESEDVTITLRDASGNGIAGIPVEITTGGYAVFEEAKGNETAEKISISTVSGENGQVTFTVKANYPGDDTIVVTIPGRDETWEIPVTVGTEYSQTVVSEPVVTINGTEYRGQGHSVTVPSGTVITVTGENAEKLYYAIGENACPCQDDQIEITGNQLTLTESGYYKFAAFADGVYSSRVHINITVTNEGGAGSGTGTGGTAPVAPVTPPSAENNFADVAENAYYYDAVMWALENGVTTGVSEDKFAPDMECSRAQAVTFLWRAAGEPKPKDGSMPFSDVAENAYYRDAVLWAVENGITNGTGEDSFSPDMKCTREQIVTFLWRTAKHLGMDVSVGEDTNILSYDDAFDIGEWAIPAVQWACGAGVMNGTSESALSPQMVCSRAQIVTFLYRTFK